MFMEIILKKLSQKSVYDSIKSLILNPKKMHELQNLSYNNNLGSYKKKFFT